MDKPNQELGKPQSEYGLAPKKRFRGRSLNTQLAEALNLAAKLSKDKVRLYEEPTAVARMQLVKTRIVTLKSLCEKKEQAKSQTLNKVLTELKAAKSEIEKLKSDIATALAAVKSAAVRPLTKAEIALQQFEEEQIGGAS
jgi:hypothetical protein